MIRARHVLMGLGVGQAAWGLATGCLLALLAARAGAIPWSVCGWAVVVPWAVLALASGLLAPRGAGRRLRTGCIGVCLGVVVLGAWQPGAWPWCLALLAAAAAIAGPAEDALLAAAARQARVPLTRVVSGVQAAILLGMAGGLFVGRALPGAASPSALPFLIPAGLYLVAFLTTAAGPAGAASGSSAGGFLRTGGRLFRDQDTRELLLASALFVTFCLLVAAAACSPESRASGSEALGLLAWVAVGAALGSLLAGLQEHPSRILGAVPIGVTGLSAVALAARGGLGPEAHGCWLLPGAFGGLTAAALRAGFLAQAPRDARGAATAWRNLSGAALAGAGLGLLAALHRLGVLAVPGARVGFLALLAAVTLPAAWWLFFRPFAEEAVVTLLRPCYRVRAHGPGLVSFPEQGPLLLLANHASWFDPLWLGQVVPRPMTPLMISNFYDKPVLHWLMSRVIRAIRVLDAPYRREAPELAEAVAELDRGRCVLIFPEGVLRRKDAVPLRPFGQGVWRILRERPATPVVVCWIEGGWGSLTSHFKGPPLAHKPMDWLRPIDIAIDSPQVLDPELLADQHATRRHLYQACIDARHHLPPEPPAPAPLAEEPVARPG